MNHFNEKTNLQDPSCTLKFSCSTVRLMQGDSASCHRCTYEAIPENFDDFHNSPLKINDRKAMSEGKWCGNGCEFCERIESLGGISDRLDYNTRPDIQKFIPPELLGKPSLQTTPTIVEMYFNNKCNLKCVYCNPTFSSAWEMENKKFGPVAQSPFIVEPVQSGYEQRVDKWFDWLKRKGQFIKTYNILGGEPFYQPELQRNIDHFIKYPAPNIELAIFSNLNIKTDRFLKYLKDFQNLIANKSLQSVKIIASIDCWGPEQEYVRFGLDLKLWKHNMDHLIRDFPEIQVQFHTTMSSLTIPTAYQLTQIINQYRNTRPVFQSINVLVHPEIMAAHIMPNEFFKSSLEKLSDEIKKGGGKERDHMVLSHQNVFNSRPHQPELIGKLKQYLVTLDQRRGTNYTKVFPWLNEL